MKECWDADPLKRPDIDTLLTKLSEINLIHESSELLTQLEKLDISNLKNYTSSSSKIHQFENLSEPRNAMEEEQEAFHSKLYDFNIPDNINDFDKPNNQESSTLNIANIFQVKNEETFKKNEEIMQKQIKRDHVNFDDENEIHNDPNLHPEEQDELELPDINHQVI
uniref:Serine-threonine/tyrosine-protein kinase catalytic domain-containing protein n=1 Tax=Rhizophagus irregularis (strain DAOM 181602 / DAOM 197198 / MUCL 43194) TaxID=747089 RepID=U9T0A4_RHIID